MMFSKEQIEGIREAYAALNKIDENELPKLKRILNQSTPTVLKQLANANIKHVSAMAQQLLSVQGRNESDQ